MIEPFSKDPKHFWPSLRWVIPQTFQQKKAPPEVQLHNVTGKICTSQMWMYDIYVLIQKSCLFLM